MSDRCLFLDDSIVDSSWADIVIQETAQNDSLHYAAIRFVNLIPPRKIMINDRNDTRFIEFIRYLKEDHYFVEGEDYTVHEVNKKYRR